MKVLKIVNAVDYANDYVNEDSFNEYVQHAFYTRDFDAETVLEMMIRDAARHNVLLKDIHNFDYDEFFYQAYLDTEKGLS